MIQHFHDILGKHKHMWLAVLGGLVLLLGTWKILAYLEGKDSKDLILKQAQLDADHKAEKAADNQKAIDQQLFDKLQAQRNADNERRDAQIADLQRQLTQRQAKDATLVPAELAARHRELIKASDIREIQPTSTGYQLSQLAELTTVQQLEVVPSLTSQNADLTGIIANKDKQIGEMDKLAKDSDAQLAICKKTGVDSDAKNKAEVAEVKAKARKSKLKWFLGGIVSGAALVAKLLI